MRNWLAKDARAHLSDVIDRALAGEPQRVTRRGKGAVVVVSEDEWRKVAKPSPEMSFGDLLASFPLGAEEWDAVAPRRRPARRAGLADEA